MVSHSGKMDGDRPAQERDVADIEDVLAVIDETARAGRVSVREVLEVIGQRAYGPILLTIGLIAVSPIGGIPGVPTAAAAIVFLLSAQILVSPRSLWLPRVLLRQSVEGEKLRKAVTVLRRPARFVDRFIRPRLTMLTHGPATIVIGVTCMLLALSVPFIELMPFAGLVPAAAFAAFGLALTAHDGLLGAVAFLLTCATFFLLGVILL